MPLKIARYLKPVMPLKKIARYMMQNAIAFLARFLSLGGAAYAANTIRTADIVDNEVFTTDVRDDTLGYGGLVHQDLGAGSVRSSEIGDSSIGHIDVASNVLGERHIQNGALNDEDVSERFLTSFQVDLGTGIGAWDCFIAFPPVLNNIQSEGDHLVLTRVSTLTTS